jgi:hypothetical protein
MSYMSTRELLAAAEAVGIQLRLKGDRIHARLPVGNDDQVSEVLASLRANRDQVAAQLRESVQIPPMPPNVRLVNWDPKVSPIFIESFSVVVDVSLFIRSTLAQLGAALADRESLVGGSVPLLLDRLRQAGAIVELCEQRCDGADPLQKRM